MPVSTEFACMLEVTLHSSAPCTLKASVAVSPLLPASSPLPNPSSRRSVQEAVVLPVQAAQTTPAPVQEAEALDFDVQKQQETGTPPATRGRRLIPSVGERTIDYLLRVVETEGGRLSLMQAASLMQALGWTTRSTELRAIHKNLRTAYSAHKDWIRFEDGILILTKAGHAYLNHLRSQGLIPPAAPTK